MNEENVELCPVCGNEMMSDGTCSECYYCIPGVMECPQCDTVLNSNSVMGECSYCPVCGEPLNW